MSHFTEDDFPPEEEIRAYHQQLQAEPKHSRGQAIPEIEWLQAKPPYVPWGLDMEAGLAAMKRGTVATSLQGFINHAYKRPNAKPRGR